MLSMVSPIVGLSRGGLRAAPDNERDKLSSFTWTEERLVWLRLVFALL